jgi:hypothetical protein
VLHPRSIPLRPAAAAIALASLALGQPQGQSPTDLINFLAYRTSREAKGQLFLANGCKPILADRADRDAAVALVKFGASAVSPIEEALDSVEQHGIDSPFSTNVAWLLYVYARVRGEAAVPRLRRMIIDPKLAFIRFGLDDEAAVSLGLTSFVSGFRSPVGAISCYPLDPRGALDSLIRGWEADDRPTFEQALGPRARLALRALMDGRSWQSLRATIWHTKSDASVGVGYRFLIPGWWSEPRFQLFADAIDADLGGYPDDPEIDTQFTNALGRDCGSIRVKFIGRYHVDAPDLRSLLSLIGTCAAGD